MSYPVHAWYHSLVCKVEHVRTGSHWTWNQDHSTFSHELLVQHSSLNWLNNPLFSERFLSGSVQFWQYNFGSCARTVLPDKGFRTETLQEKRAAESSEDCWTDHSCQKVPANITYCITVFSLWEWLLGNWTNKKYRAELECPCSYPPLRCFAKQSQQEHSDQVSPVHTAG